ncbi:MAG: hypothetical protein JXR41_10465 [Bacteroidales bacterium]|nr:hypothetical protein [Bacteroidales bacterium]
MILKKVFNSSYNLLRKEKYTYRRNEDYLNYLCTPAGAGITYNRKYPLSSPYGPFPKYYSFGTQFNILLYPFNLYTEEIYDYPDGDPSRVVYTKTEYDYEERFNLPVRQATTLENGDQLIKKTSYAWNISGNSQVNAINKPALEKNIKYENGGSKYLTGALRYEYTNSNNILSLDLVQTRAIETPVQNDTTVVYSSEPTTNYLTDLEITQYDDKGNPVEAIGRDGITRSFIWAYNKDKLVIKAENVSYQNLSSAVSSIQSNLESYLTGTIGNMTTDTQKNAWKSFNTSLRSALSSAVISTFTYKTLVGMTSQTGPDGVTIYYTYDSLGRLESVKNDDRKLLNKYTYHYAGQ